MNNLFEFDLDIIKNVNKKIVGIDEVGRGPGAGPVVSCAYLFFDDFINRLSDIEYSKLAILNDSKKLSSNNREILSKILKKCGKYAIFYVDEKKIDEVNILNATFLAMKGAINGLNLNNEEFLFLVDGNKKINDFDFEQKNLIKGDAKSASIAAASIIAKVERDNFMIELSKKNPQYAWDKNKGYLTKAHIQAIVECGASEFHRKTFIKNFLN